MSNNTLQQKGSLKTKLSLLVATAVMLAVTVLGFYFDASLKNNSLDNAHTRILHGYQRLSFSLEDIEHNLKEGIVFTQQDEKMLASIELVNNYQDKNNYNAYLLDEEKKILANMLLNKAKLSFNDDAVLYDKNHELIAFVSKQLKGYQLGYVSYKDGHKSVYKRYENQRDYKSDDLQLSKNIPLDHKQNHDRIKNKDLLNYHQLDERIAIKVHNYIHNDAEQKIISGYIEISRIIDQAYFNQLSEALNIDISYSFNPDLQKQADLLEKSLDLQKLNIIQNKQNYTVILKQKINDGSIYYVAKLDNTKFKTLLSESRIQFLMILVLSTFSILLVMRYIINYKLDRPLSMLMEQIHKIEHQDYSASTPVATDDELGAVSININRLALTVQEREHSLKTSMIEQEQLSSQVRLLLDSTAEAIYGLDLNGKCSFANPACVQLLGYRDADELIGQNMHQLIHHTHTDGTVYPENDCPIFHAYLKGTASHIDSDVLWRADGSSFPAEYWSHPIYDGDEIMGSVVTFLDITVRNEAEKALRDSEAHLRTLIETLPDLVWLKDVDGVYLSCNLKFEQLFGAKENEIVGKTDYDFVDKELADFFREHDKAAMAAGKPSVNEEQVTYADDSHKEILETVKTPMFSPDGTLIGVLGVGRDITERRQTEEVLRRSQKMDAIGQLTGGIAHDFNNLLGVMLGNLELLEQYAKDTGDEKTLKRMQTIEKAGLRAADLTRQLLSFSRSESAHLSKININQVISEMTELITRSLTPEIEVKYIFSEDLWDTKIDAGDFEDVLLNLSINARDSMKSHGKLTIETHNFNTDESFCKQNPGSCPGQYIELIVSDTGEGIPSELRERIFEPFFTTKDQGKGTGLGLAMVYAFVKRSNGYIKYQSEVGSGTAFHIYLPKVEGEAFTVRQNNKQSESIPHGKETILVVDDEKALVEMAKVMLEAQGYQVLTANDGKEALAQLAQHSEIDLLFSDIVMPNGINGYELAEQATANRRDLKVLLTSGFTEKADPHDEQKRFNANLLNKPYRKAELAKQVRSTLDELEIQ